MMSQEKQSSQKQPIFTLPKVVIFLVGLIWAIYFIENYLLKGDLRETFILSFAFIPYRFISPAEFSDGLLPLIWSPFTHALLHAGWEHLLINSLWLAIFGTPVAYRYGAFRFLVIFFISAAVGALVFALVTMPEVVLLVGASGGISGLTGVAIRFIFQPIEVRRDPQTAEVIALGRRLASFADMKRDIRTRSFIIIWVGLNAIIPLGEFFFAIGDFQIAWQAHLGGFFAGLLLAPLFEKQRQNA